MKKLNYSIEVTEQSPELPLFCEKQRQVIINNLAEKALEQCAAEEEAIGLFMYKSRSVNQKELMLFHALYLMHQSCRDTRIKCEEEALSILDMSEGKTVLPEEEFLKEAKRLYWKQFNELSCDLKSFLKHAKAIGMRKCAFDYLLNSHTAVADKLYKY
jgi:hypothetical protein